MTAIRQDRHQSPVLGLWIKASALLLMTHTYESDTLITWLKDYK